MNQKSPTKKVAFCCPQHGVLNEPVEYISVDMGTKKLVDVPIMYCKECSKYYTPFTNFLAFAKPLYKGRLIAASQGRVEKSIPRIEVRTPCFVDLVKENPCNEQTTQEEKKRARQLRLEKAEQQKQYIESLRNISYNAVVLSNKDSFVREKRCPRCLEKVEKEHAKIIQGHNYILANVWHCNHCDSDYITPAQFTKIYQKAMDMIRGFYWGAFVSPMGIECHQNEDGKYLCIPQWALDIDKYDRHHLPPRGDAYYDMTDEEYSWVMSFYQPEEFLVPLRKKSFLAEAGYSTSESEIRRHNILEKCVKEYGKSKVINQLKSNISLRSKQKNGSIRYQRAINIWHGDMWFVENEL